MACPDYIYAMEPLVIPDARGHSVTLCVKRWHHLIGELFTVEAQCDCGWDWSAQCDRYGRVARLTAERSHEVGRHQAHASRDYCGPAIEVHQRGHSIKIIRGDHPAAFGIVTSREDDWIRGYQFTAEDRVAVCSCGAWTYHLRGRNGRPAENAAEWAERHAGHSARPTRVRKWTRARGWVPTAAAAAEQGSTMEELDVLRARRDELERQIAIIDSFPEEPLTEDVDEANVIWFTKRFGRTEGWATDYTYAAVRASDGLWYTTGPKAPKAYTWQELIAWINSDGDGPVDVWFAAVWEKLER